MRFATHQKHTQDMKRKNVFALSPTVCWGIEMLPVNFRVDEGDLKRAQARIKETGVKLPDLMRLAVKAIADGDGCVA